ncbi:hypothetical protein QBC41DRAFT_392332 [Cercophora samala]|uniref:Uncharacterized protein n=1 Tax=Cercophora samala TaxID=330535 RepID=A0AA39ZDP5_9PEZI|nr:hypothetical protein QBC41DRAFT_392332 [Cercophora samala]
MDPSGHENSSHDSNHEIYPMWYLDPSNDSEAAPGNAAPIDQAPVDLWSGHYLQGGDLLLGPLLEEEAFHLDSQESGFPEQQYQPLEVHHEQVPVEQVQYAPLIGNGEQADYNLHHLQFVGQPRIDQDEEQLLSPQIEQESLPDDQQPLPNNPTPPDTANQQEAPAMTKNKEKVNCPGCNKALEARSMYNHKKICRKLNPESNLLQCTLPLVGRNPAKICDTQHRSKTALRDHQQTGHHHFALGEPSYEKRDSTDASYLKRVSKSVLVSRVALEGAQLLEHAPRLTSQRVIENLDEWVKAGTTPTKDALVERLVSIRNERKSLGLDILV